MALPRSISGVAFSDQNYNHGPFRAPDGKHYIITLDSTNAYQVEAWMADNGDAAWAELDSGNKPDIGSANPIKSLWATQDPTYPNWLHVAYQANDTSGMDPVNTVYYSLYAMSDNSANALISSTNTSGTEMEVFGGSGTQEELGQSFTSDGTQTHVTAVTLILKKVGTPTDNITVKITSSLGGATLDSYTFLASEVGAGVTAVNCPFDVTLSTSTTYYIEVSRSGSRDASNYITWERGGSYAGGAPQLKESGSWSADGSTTDRSFQVYYGGWINFPAGATTLDSYIQVSTNPDGTAVACSIAVRSDGDIIILYQGATIADMGADWETIKYARWEGYATGWTVDQAVEGAAQVNYTGAVIVHNPDNDKSHFFYEDDTNNDVLHKELTSGNSLDGSPDTVSTTQSNATDYVVGPGAYYNPTGAVAERITIPWLETGSAANKDGIANEIDDGGTPSADEEFNDATSDQIKLDGTQAMLGITYRDGDIVVAWWASNSDSDLYYSSNDDSGGWDAETNGWTATINALSCNIYAIDDASIVLGIIADDGGTIKYHEVTLVSGGTETPQAVAGTQNSSGVVTGKALKAVAGSQGSSGVVATKALKAVAGTQNSSGDVFKQAQPAALTGSQGSSGALTAVKIAFQAVAGTQNSSGDVTKQAQPGALTGSQGASGDVAKLTQPGALTGTHNSSGVLTTAKLSFQTNTGTQNSSGDVAKLTQPGAITGTQNSSGALATAKITAQAIAGTQNSSGDVTKQAQPAALTGSQATSGDIAKLTQPGALAGSQSSSGALAAVKTTLQSVAGEQATSGALAKETQPAALTATQNTSGTIAKQAQPAALAGSQGSSGVLAAIKTALKSIAGTQNTSGTLSTAKTTAQAVAGEQTSSGDLTKQTNKPVAGSQNSSGALATAKTTAQAVAGTQNSSGVLSAIKTALKSIAGTQGSSGALTALAQKVLGGSQGSSGDATKETQPGALAGSQGSSGALASLKIPGGTLYTQDIAGTQNSSGTVATVHTPGGVSGGGGATRPRRRGRRVDPNLEVFVSGKRVIGPEPEPVKTPAPLVIKPGVAIARAIATGPVVEVVERVRLGAAVALTIVLRPDVHLGNAAVDIQEVVGRSMTQKPVIIMPGFDLALGAVTAETFTERALAIYREYVVKPQTSEAERLLEVIGEPRGFSKRQIARILDFEGKPIIPQGAHGNLSVQVAESWLRRRLFAVEDQAIVEMFADYKRTWNRLRGDALDFANQTGLGNRLGPDAESLLFRRRFMELAVEHLTPLIDRTAQAALEASTTSWLVGYFGRLWELDIVTAPDWVINAPLPSMVEVTRDVVRFGLREAVNENLVLDLLGAEWRERYATEMDDLLLRMTRSLNGSINDGLGMRQAMRKLADVMGVDIDRRRVAGNTRANFNKVQAITRTSIQDSSTRGTLAAYRQNRDIVRAVEFLETLDNRVCAICDRRQGGLGGTIWPIDSPQMERPPVHINCRCDLIPVLFEDFIFGDDEPPRSTMSEFMAGLGAAWMLQEFLTGHKKDSSRIGDDEDEEEIELEFA